MLGDMREEKKLSHITPLSPTIYSGLMVTAVLYKELIKSKSWLTGFAMPPSGRKFLFCAYFIARLNTKAMVSSNFFLWLVYLSPLVCPRTIICQGYHLYHIKKNRKYKTPWSRFQWKSLQIFISITNEWISTKLSPKLKDWLFYPK